MGGRKISWSSSVPVKIQESSLSQPFPRCRKSHRNRASSLISKTPIKFVSRPVVGGELLITFPKTPVYMVGRGIEEEAIEKKAQKKCAEAA